MITIAGTSARRPLAAWLLLAASALAVIGLSVGVARLGQRVVGSHEALTASIALAMGWRVGLAILLTLVMLSVHRAKRLGRWLGVILLACVAAWSCLHRDTNIYPNAAQQGGAMVARLVVVPLSLAWWAYAFAWSPKATRYFGRRSPSEV